MFLQIRKMPTALFLQSSIQMLSLHHWEYSRITVMILCSCGVFMSREAAFDLTVRLAKGSCVVVVLENLTTTLVGLG